MKTLMTLVLLCMLSGCASDVSQELPHSRLIGTAWKLKTNAYVLELKYNYNKKRLYIVPCVKGRYYFSDWDYVYDESKIGQESDGSKVVGGLREGEILTIIRILKVPHIEMGTSYHPIMVPEKSNKWTGGEELDGEFLYDQYYDKGILNPEYAERVSIATNPPPRGAEGGSGSEEINP